MEIMKNIRKAEVVKLKEEVSYQDGQVVSKTLVQNSAVSVTLFSFAKGEEISTHESKGDAFVTCLDGCTETTYLRNAGKGGMRRETARKPAISTGKRHFSGGKGFAIINNLENEGIGFEQGPFLMPWSGQKSPKTQRRTHGR